MSARQNARCGSPIVGAGVMAEAMISGLLADPRCALGLVASHPRRDRREALAERHGITVVARNAEAVPPPTSWCWP